MHLSVLSAEWECALQEYARANPHVRVIDSVDGIRMLRNRATMLSVLQSRDIVVQVRCELRAKGFTRDPAYVQHER